MWDRIGQDAAHCFKDILDDRHAPWLHTPPTCQQSQQWWHLHWFVQFACANRVFLRHTCRLPVLLQYWLLAWFCHFYGDLSLSCLICCTIGPVMMRKVLGLFCGLSWCFCRFEASNCVSGLVGVPVAIMMHVLLVVS
jgi:hypothetical protein